MYKINLNKKKGFTLIELVVVAGIMSAIMLLITFNSRTFNEGLVLQTASSEVSLAMRQAQSFGISIKQSNNGVNSFDKPYGIVFDLQNQTNYFIYSDTNNNFKYDGTSGCSGSDECREKNNIRGATKVNRVCAKYTSNSSLTCFNGSARYLVLTYVRPNPEPVIKIYDSSNSEIVGPWKEALVELISNNGTKMYVVTDSASGQIVIQSTPIIP
ncbi:MAG: pilus assembly FimT family protein [Minisyncoccota bacterium]